jgi:hypothetical protein
VIRWDRVSRWVPLQRFTATWFREGRSVHSVTVGYALGTDDARLARKASRLLTQWGAR